MKRMRVFLCLALLIVSLWAGVQKVVYADSLPPLSLFDINSLPAVATDGNDNFTITWGFIGQGHMPGILAKRYNGNGDPIDTTAFWVNSSSEVSSLLNYDPDIATDSTNNAVITWCSYGLASSPSNIQVVYSKVPPQPTVGAAAVPTEFTAVSPQQSEGAVNLLRIPFTPVVAVDDSDNTAIAWSYLDAGTLESGIYLAIIDSSGTVGDPVKVVDNSVETTLPDDDTVEAQSAFLQVNQATNPVFFYSPAIAIDGEGNIVVTWTETGLIPFLTSNIQLPRSAVYYSKYTSSGSVVSGHDKQMVDLGFNSTVAVHDGTVIIAWNAFDLFTWKIRVMVKVFSDEIMSTPMQLGTRAGYSPAAFVDAGNYLGNTGLDITADTDGNFFVAWGGSNFLSNHIYLKKIYSDGISLSNDIQVSRGIDVNYSPSIAADTQGNIIVTWNKVSITNLLTGISSINARRYDNNLQALGDEFKVNLSY